MNTQLQVQELFDDLQLSPAHHRDEDGDSSTSEDSALQRKLEKFRNSRNSQACDSIDKEDEIAKLISYFMDRGSHHTAPASTMRQSSTNAPALVLPPAVRFQRKSRKAVTNQ
jgi:hypothetical protein